MYSNESLFTTLSVITISDWMNLQVLSASSNEPMDESTSRGAVIVKKIVTIEINSFSLFRKVRFD